jgi:altronate hydrolase
MSAPHPLFRLHPRDNVLVARRQVPAGTVWESEDNTAGVTTREAIDMGHKVALRPIAQGESVYKFGQPIGYASRAIAPGEWVHVHNVAIGELQHDYGFCSAIPEPPTPITGRTFQGYRRANGKAATRNYIGIVSTVNCSATSSKFIAQQFGQELLADFPNVDGVIPLVHKGGCAFEFGGPDHRLLNRTLAGFARHANIGAYLILGLGCETAQASFLADEHSLVQLDGAETSGPRPLVMNIQDEGGVKKTVKRAVGVLKEMLPDVNRVQRVPIPLSELILGTNCGGSDGNSGVTANPALGIASDLLVAAGGTSVLAETPEIYGGEHLLTRRAASPAVAEKLLDKIRWWEDYAKRFGAKIDNNPSFGNKKGGLTTIYEKSLGAIAKGGNTALTAVYDYAEPVTEKGFVVMDTPGFDPPSVTGIIAGGAQVVVFTTGRGSCYACKPAPTIKVATNTLMYNRMVDDMDINAGRILDGDATLQQVGEEMFERIIAVASGEKTKSEAQNIGDEEFCPWVPGPVF